VLVGFEVNVETPSQALVKALARSTSATGNVVTSNLIGTAVTPDASVAVSVLGCALLMATPWIGLSPE
jgi:hypothetical protein